MREYQRLGAGALEDLEDLVDQVERLARSGAADGGSTEIEGLLRRTRRTLARCELLIAGTAESLMALRVAATPRWGSTHGHAPESSPGRVAVAEACLRVEDVLRTIDGVGRPAELGAGGSP